MADIQEKTDQFIGGDGTLNEAANGLAHTDTALAALPGGSTNVFARIQGLPDDPIDAAGVLLEALAAQSIKRVGLGRVASRYFLFHCGVGFDAAVVENVERHGSWKRWAGHPLFIYAAIDTWLRGTDRRRPPLRVMVGDQAEADATSGPILKVHQQGLIFTIYIRNCISSRLQA